MGLRRPVRGLLLAPAVVPIAYWLGMTAETALLRSRFGADDAFAELGPVLMVGLPVAYAVMLVWGVPAAFVLYRFGALRASTMITVGALGGIAVALYLAGVQGGGPIRIRLSVPLGGLLGALAGAVAWWAGRGSHEPPKRAPSDSPRGR